jgi:hypothetical protein
MFNIITEIGFDSRSGSDINRLCFWPTSAYQQHAAGLSFGVMSRRNRPERVVKGNGNGFPGSLVWIEPVVLSSSLRVGGSGVPVAAVAVSVQPASGTVAAGEAL